MDSDERESVERILEHETDFQKRQKLMKRLWYLIRKGSRTRNAKPATADDDKQTPEQNMSAS